MGTLIHQRVLTDDHGKGAGVTTEGSSESRSDQQRSVFRRRAADCLELFAVLSGFVKFNDADRAHVYAFADNLMQTFPGLREELPLEAVQAIDRNRAPRRQ